MPVRNQLFPQTRKPAPVSKQRTKADAAAHSAPATTTVAAINDVGVVVTPRFTKARPLGKAGDIEFRIEAHQFDDGLWGAEFLYVSRTDSIPLFGTPLNTKAARFQTLAEAVGDAYDRGLVSIKKEKHTALPRPNSGRRSSKLWPSGLTTLWWKSAKLTMPCGAVA